VIIPESNANQHVIPRWMGYLKSMELNELGRPADNRLWNGQFSRPSLVAELNAYLLSREHRHGAELFERLLMAGADDLARQIAPLLVGDLRLAKPLRDIAARLLDMRQQHFSDPTCDELIRMHKRYLREYPRNGIRWVEVARLYTIKRQYDKAHDALNIAFNLNPRDRYTVRSLIRYLIHVQQEKETIKVLGSDIGKISDPWLKGIGLSALMMAEKGPKTRLFGAPSQVARDELFENSEFLAACGMLFLSEGKDKSAKSYFRTAWTVPSGNVTTHAEWITRSMLPDLRSEALSLEGKTAEAKAGQAYSCAEWSTMSDAVQEWILEEPYSTKPFRFLALASNVRGLFAECLKWIDKIEKAGRCDFGTKISKLYALLSLKQLSEADKIFSDFDIDSLKPVEKVLVLANLGLYLVQKGLVDDGLAIYRRAELEALSVSTDLSAKVFINSMVAAKIGNKTIDNSDYARLKGMAEGFKHDIGVSLLLKKIDPVLYRFDESSQKDADPKGSNPAF
jgi:tetratricopeptide (TPR) repeat protein